LGIRYPKPASQDDLGDSQTQNQQNLEGKIAAYALGDDYHLVLPERLRALVDFIETQTGVPVPNRWYTDTGPILEKELAQRAGLGWIGKNTCLINPAMGSYFLLAEILLGIELEKDDPIERDYCGSCRRCLDHCPTGCILPDRTIDAGRCISYLTIEQKGFIPVDLRQALGTWVFGCDICQQVCPWNQKFSSHHHEVAFSARPGLPPKSLIDEIRLTPKEFNQKFKGNPLKRAKRRGYLRNVAIAIGNNANTGTIPALIEALGDPEPLIRGHAAWALGRTRSTEVLDALIEAHEQEKDLEVAAEIQSALKNDY
jgi:epoxyqueuosine reductase